jgi:hypothetical protein
MLRAWCRSYKTPSRSTLHAPNLCQSGASAEPGSCSLAACTKPGEAYKRPLTPLAAYPKTFANQINMSHDGDVSASGGADRLRQHGAPAFRPSIVRVGRRSWRLNAAS